MDEICDRCLAPYGMDHMELSLVTDEMVCSKCFLEQLEELTDEELEEIL